MNLMIKSLFIAGISKIVMADGAERGPKVSCLEKARLDRVIATPRFHHWHHSAEEHAVDKNFAVHLPLLDYLFGTLLLTRDGSWPAAYGIAGNPIPEKYFVHTAYPFAPRRFERSKPNAGQV